jgi:hypothetical protein
MFARVKTSRGNEYLQLVENYREGGRVRQRLVLYVGHYAGIDDALSRLPREVSYLRGRATRAGQTGPGGLREAAEEAAAKLAALRRMVEEHPGIRERDRARAARHAERELEARARRREERERGDQQSARD